MKHLKQSLELIESFEAAYLQVFLDDQLHDVFLSILIKYAMFENFLYSPHHSDLTVVGSFIELCESNITKVLVLVFLHII